MEYIYIVQASLEPSRCKIGKTNDLDRRLKEYNSMTGKSSNNIYQYLFSCQVLNMHIVENDIKEEYRIQRETRSREIYFYNKPLFENYVNFIKEHPLFVREVFVKAEEKKEGIKIIKKTTPSLEKRGLSSVDIMNKSKKINNDEFYTRYEDIEKELVMYDKEIWKDTVVFCNCDDAVGNDERDTSAFVLYFLNNFKELGLKKLICTHYGGGADLFKQGSKGIVYIYIFTRDGYEESKQSPKNYTGSFDDPFSLKILHEEADIVCTNPPFSKAVKYWKIIIESGKKFLIISNIANPLTTAYVKYFKDNKVWAGYNEIDWFLNYKKELVRAAGFWYTNITITDRPNYKQLKIKPLKDIPDEYKKYDDAKILLVDHCYIPKGYKKPFAVSTRPILNGLLEKGYKIVQDKEYYPRIKGKKVFGRVLVQKI
jgi:predicted GIY-YIG superfamily endonuclease